MIHRVLGVEGGPKGVVSLFLLVAAFASLVAEESESPGAPRPAAERQTIRSLYVPLADHYAALVAYDRYRGKMVHTDFQIEQMKSWDHLRAYFQSGEVDMAFVMGPLAMDMFRERPDFRWIGLMHRDGTALAINDLLNKEVGVPEFRKDRKPDSVVADALKAYRESHRRPVEIGMPHLLSTHTVVLYRYLKEHGASLALHPRDPGDALAIAVPPPESPVFLASQSNRSRSAGFEQSLPWADIVETQGFGHVAWYSKDVMPWDKGHVECIVVVTDKAIAEKRRAVKEVMAYIHKAADEIEAARREGGDVLRQMVTSIRRHVPAHTRKGIYASLNHDLRVINFEDLDVDKEGLRLIMDWAVEGGILREPIDIDAFADTSFGMKELAGIASETEGEDFAQVDSILEKIEK